DPSGHNRLNWGLMPNLPPEVLDATAAYLRSVIETQSPSSAYNTFSGLKVVFDTPGFMDIFAAGETTTVQAFRSYINDAPNAWRAHYARQWYSWCATMGYPDFSAEVALE